MGDHDRRDYRGGGGYGGGRNKRKRFREDDDYDQGHRNQRPRHDQPPGTRIRKALLEIGEDSGRLPQDVATNIASLVADNYEDDYVKETFAVVVLKLISEQPFKIPFVAAVVLYVHGLRSQVAQDVVARAVVALQEKLDAGQFRASKLLLRFLACLSRLFVEDGVLPILDELFNRAVDLQTASPDDAVGIELVKIILFTIPYLVAASEDASISEKVAALLEKTDIVASAPHPLQPLVDPYPAVEDVPEKPMVCATVISLLQRQLQDEAGNGWPLACIPRVYDPSHKAKSANGDADGDVIVQENGESTKLRFPEINVPSPINAVEGVLFPEIYFSLYADQEIESVPTTAHVASLLLRDAILDTINILDFNRNATAKFLNEIDCFWAAGTFVKRSTAFDKLKDMPEGKSTWKPEDICIDAIFSQIFTMPAPNHKLVYYHSLITESCKISPGAIAPSLGRAIRFLFRNVEFMDMELSYRFMDWFAHHLSNFEFRWKWTEWIGELKLPELHPKKAFIRGVLEKEIQLSFAKRVRDTLPEPYHSMIPKSKENEVPEFKYNNDQTPFAQEGREVLGLLKKKAPESEIQTILDSVQQQAADHGIDDPLVATTDIYMTSICSIGSKSLSHVLSTIDRCKERLIALGPQSEPARRQIISSVVNFWIDQPGTAVNIIDKLLNYTIITPMSVIEWGLRDQMDRGRALASPQIHEMVAITMFKVTNRVRQVLRERNNLALPYEQRQQIDEALPRERDGMRELFAAIEDAVGGVADGANDEMIERYDDGSSERDLIQLWGARWARVWRRKGAVEEAVVGEAAIGPLQEAPAPEPEAEMVVDGGEGNQELDEVPV